MAALETFGEGLLTAAGPNQITSADALDAAVDAIKSITFTTNDGTPDSDAVLTSTLTIGNDGPPEFTGDVFATIFEDPQIQLCRQLTLQLVLKMLPSS